MYRGTDETIRVAILTLENKMFFSIIWKYNCCKSFYVVDVLGLNEFLM